MKRPKIELDIEKNISELTISPDGRVFAFGASRPILELLAALAPHDRRIKRMLRRVRASGPVLPGDIE
jgi:hypothetical protein